MGILATGTFYNFIKQLPDNEVNTDVIISYFAEHVPKLAEAGRLAFLRAALYSRDVRNKTCTLDNEYVYGDITSKDEQDEKKIHFDIVNGDFVEVTACPAKGLFWDKDMEEDFYVIARLLYNIYGRAKITKEFMGLLYTDNLTGVGNEAALYRYMGKKLAEGTFFSYCTNFINMKNMKLMNNRYGQKTGDGIMKGYAQAINRFIGSDGFISRLGGDNFLVFLHKERQSEFISFMEKLIVKCKAMDGSDLDVRIDSRIGYYYLQEGDSISDAMNNSSIAFNVTKRNGNCNVLMYESRMKNRMLYHKQLEESIPGAVANREFTVFYQPKASIRDVNKYSIVGAEALVRWFKDGKLISPGEFVPMLEENGMITKIDFYVLEQVCRDIKDWEQKGYAPIKISTNFSRRNLQDEHFSDKIEAIVKKYDVDPALIEVEITESYDVEDMIALKKFEEHMHRLGITMAVDDFGSGFSSLKMLKNISADTVKLDKSIIDDVGSNKTADQTIVGNIINMIKELGKEVIAEGVECKEQADFLRKRGCPAIQGYLFARPMPKEDMERLYLQNL